MRTSAAGGSEWKHPLEMVQVTENFGPLGSANPPLAGVRKPHPR